MASRHLNVAHYAVWLVFLDPQCSLNHAKTATWPEGPGRCELDCGQSSWSRTFQLASGCRMGPQPVPGEWGSAYEHTLLSIPFHNEFSTFSTHSLSSMKHLPPSARIGSPLCVCSYFWACIPMNTSLRSQWRQPWNGSGGTLLRSAPLSRGGTKERSFLTTICPPTESQTVLLFENMNAPLLGFGKKKEIWKLRNLIFASLVLDSSLKMNVID